VLRLGLGPAAVAIGAITAGLAIYQRQQEKAAREMAEAEERADNLARALDGVSESARSVEEQVRIASGEIDSFGIAAETQAVEAQAASDLVVAAYDAEIQATENRIASLRAEVKQGKNVSDELREQRLELIDLTSARDDEIERVERQIDTIGLLLEFREESRKAIEDEADAEREAAKARRNQEKADRERASALEELDRIDTDARRSAMTDEAALIDQYEERIDRVRELGQLT
jgi:chromosome segregation ATPase